MMRDHLNQAVYGAQRSAIREFSALAKATPGCVSLTLGEPDSDTPEPVRAAAKRALDNHETHYIPNGGAPALREKLAQFEARQGMDYRPEEIIVTAGATEALFVALFGILNPGDEVIIPIPAFVLYAEIVRLCRGVPVFLDTAPDGFQIHGEKLRRLISRRTKAIILNSPNNPTGCVYTPESLLAVRDAVENAPVFVLCDDVYRQLVYADSPAKRAAANGLPAAPAGGAAAPPSDTPPSDAGGAAGGALDDAYHSFAEFRELRDRLLVVQSFSKPYAMTGWRMGYLMADRRVMERLELLHQFMVVSTPAPFQQAAMAALDFDPAPLRECYRRRRAYVLSRLEGMGLPFARPRGAFYVFPSVAAYGIPSWEFCTRMVREAGLAATPGVCFGGEGYIRLSYACGDELLQTGLDRLERFLVRL